MSSSVNQLFTWGQNTGNPLDQKCLRPRSGVMDFDAWVCFCFFIRSLHISAVSKVSCAKEDYQTRDLSVNRANNAHIATFLLFPFEPSKPNIERILDVPIRSYVHHDEFAAITHLLVSYFIASGISERLVRNVFGIPEHQIIEYATKQFK